MPELPTHLVVGRGAFPGPTIGGYCCFTFGPCDVGVGETDIVPLGFIAPCDMRLERISYFARAVGIGVATCNFYKDTADFVVATGGVATRLHDDADISAEATAGSYIEKGAGGISVLTESARDISKGNRVYVAVTTDGTGSLTDFSVQFDVFLTGHINTDAAND